MHKIIWQIKSTQNICIWCRRDAIHSFHKYHKYYHFFYFIFLFIFINISYFFTKYPTLCFVFLFCASNIYCICFYYSQSLSRKIVHNIFVIKLVTLLSCYMLLWWLGCMFCKLYAEARVEANGRQFYICYGISPNQVEKKPFTNHTKKKWK